LEIIEQAARDGAETVRRIQEFARNREDDKYLTSLDINEAIEHALEFTRVRWKDEGESKGIQFDIQKELSLLPPVRGSASELREVFTNLINNALDAMPQGGHLRITTFQEDSLITIKVEDNGAGIPQVIRNRIYDPFFTTKGPQSSGLGLSVSYGIITRHQGTITVDSTEGKGTTFIVTLPLSQDTMTQKKVKPFPGKQRKARILVIDDEEAVRNLLAEILLKGGHEVVAASSGKQGVEIFEKVAFDLVFTDLGMPEMSGWQVAEKVKSINGRVPVVLLTGWEVTFTNEELRDKWVDLVIKKPFEVNQVLGLVQQGMELRDRSTKV
jgi:CheY-like chemotaxis protein/anti-sigma regulatory factor (Ser/Thr protein kinase)